MILLVNNKLKKVELILQKIKGVNNYQKDIKLKLTKIKFYLFKIKTLYILINN